MSKACESAPKASAQRKRKTLEMLGKSALSIGIAHWRTVAGTPGTHDAAETSDVPGAGPFDELGEVVLPMAGASDIEGLP